MRAVWVDANNHADFGRLFRNGIDTPYFALNDPLVTKAYLQDVRARGFTPGVYAAWNWQHFTTGSDFALWVHKRLNDVAKDTPPTFPLVSLDIELHDPIWVTQALQSWRRLRKERVTDWTLEGMQGGLFTRDQAQYLASLVRYVCPQAYTGDMTPMDAVTVALDLAQAGFPPRSIQCFYAADSLPAAWSGTAFPQGRLP